MDASVAFLLDNLKQLVKYPINLITGAENELKQLENELEFMKAKLEDLSKMRNKEEVLKRWERQIREVIYEVEDIIDTCVTQAHKTTMIKRLFGQESTRLAKEVKCLRENKVKPVFELAMKDFASLGNTDAHQTSREENKDKRKKDPRQVNVVGFEDETDTLIKCLNEESDKLEVLSIIGMPGLGKTTVAWKIYQDSKIKYEFPAIIWLYISQEFNKRDMLLTILKKFTQQDMSNNSDEDLSQKVRDYLTRGKFLIFMDDVWTVQAWNEIKEVLPMDNKLGKVMITSRDKNVAQHANRTRDPHQLRFLTPAESWELLQLEVYGKVGAIENGLEYVGQNIARQCNGLPLSIIVIGGILVDKLSTSGGDRAVKDEWRKVSESVDKYVIHGDKEKLISNIISLSYTELPYDLRDCFLYLGMFPEDPEIPAWKLTKLWIAEGFIKQNPLRSLEEVAQDNLTDLINRNLVMVQKTKPDGEVKTCRVHDTIREFCKNEAAFNNQNLFQEIVRNTLGVFEPPVVDIQKYRRLCIHSYVHDFLHEKPNIPKTRSFLCFSKAPIILQNEDISTITRAFSLVRVLDANTMKFPKFPFKITELLHLRYLTLSGDEFGLLPEAIRSLWNLQTLIVDTSSRTLKIEADIWELMQLRHLKTKASIILIKNGKGAGGKNLQTLGRLSPQSCTNEVFSKAKNLITLGIRGDLSALSESKWSEKLQILNKLTLVHDAYPKVVSENPLPSLPLPNAFPPNLKILILSGTFLDWKHMSTVGQLGALEVLKLKDNAFLGSYWDVFGGGFNLLEFLYIERTDLTYWTVTSNGFPRLRSLVLKNCEKLQGVPLELKENLKMLSMERVTPFAVSSARKIEQALQQMPEQERAKRGGFKVVIAPGDQVPNF